MIRLSGGLNTVHRLDARKDDLNDPRSNGPIRALFRPSFLGPRVDA